LGGGNSSVVLLPEAFAQNEFSAFWNKFRSAVIAGDKASVADMAKFPLSMAYLVKAVRDKQDFLHRYNEIFEARRTPPNVLQRGFVTTSHPAGDGK